MTALSRYTIIRSQSLNIFTNLEYDSSIAIACSTRMANDTVRFTPVNIIVDFRTHTDDGIIVFN